MLAPGYPDGERPDYGTARAQFSLRCGEPQRWSPGQRSSRLMLPFACPNPPLEVCYLAVPPGGSLRIDAPAPEDCPF